MIVCGIVAEYDPFHRGHLYQLKEARQKSQADFMVCVLGSAFSQRGEAMMFDTMTRARMALHNGFDLVLGMPVSFSCAQANRFAMGGVGILHQLGVVTHQSFGCETDDLAPLLQTAYLLHQPTAAFTRQLKAALAQGHSFAAARGLALAACLPGVSQSLLAAPNFILGVAYLLAHLALGSDIQPLPVLRQTDYHSPEAGPRASASAVRRLILEGRQAELQEACPPASLQLMNAAAIHPPEALDKALLVKLRAMSDEELRAVPEISEGLEQRIRAASREAVSRADLISQARTRRYPKARISRALSQALLGITLEHSLPPYARLLGFKTRARPLLAAIRAQGFPLVDRPARERRVDIHTDMAAEEIWYIGSGQPMKAAWQQRMIQINNQQRRDEDARD